MFRLNVFVIQDLLIAAGLIASFSLFLEVKREIHTQSRRYKAALREIEELLPKLRAAAIQNADFPQNPENAAIPLPANQPARSGFNLQRRAQAVRLLRRGEDVAHVSAVLGVPRGEVELLIRVQKLAAGSPVKTTSVQTT